MTDVSVEQLQAADSALGRSFIGAATTVVLTLAFGLLVAPSLATSPGSANPVWAIVALALLAAEIGCYVWYAISAGAAARLLGSPAWHFVTWILVAPFLALAPIPIVSTIIGVSPLSIKFLLGGQLQTAIRQATFSELHRA